MTEPRSRQQIAQRMHDLLRLEIGHAIHIGRLLDEPHYARDVLLVCDACDSAELVALAASLRTAPPGPEGLPAAETPLAPQQPSFDFTEIYDRDELQPDLLNLDAGARRHPRADARASKTWAPADPRESPQGTQTPETPVVPEALVEQAAVPEQAEHTEPVPGPLPEPAITGAKRRLARWLGW